MQKAKVFISHINEDSYIAKELEAFLKDSLSNALSFFVSSSRTSIQVGDKWLEIIEQNLKESKILIVLCSNESVVRPWINFETGGAWISNKKVIPLCLPGMNYSDLPEPLHSLQSYSLSNEDDVAHLLKILSGIFKLTPPEKNDKVHEFCDRIKKLVPERKKLAQPKDIENFLNNLDYDQISSIDILGHTGQNLIQAFFNFFENRYDLIDKLRDVRIRILLRNPIFEIGIRAAAIQLTNRKINEWRGKGFKNICVHYYHNLPTFRAISCKRKNLETSNRVAFINFYYFPLHRPSKTYPHKTISIDEKDEGRHYLIDVVDSWFNHFWGKSEEKEIHTIIFDFDDTIVNSHSTQIDAWVDLINEARNRYKIDINKFSKNLVTCFDDPEKLRQEMKKIFFLEQDANNIFNKIFSKLPPEITDELHQRRFEIRVGKMRDIKAEDLFFPNFKNVIKDIANSYRIIIVSATDEDLILDFLEGQKIEINGIVNLRELFWYIFGKRESVFDWKNIERKSQLVFKIVNILGVPIERLVYVGDSHRDFIASNNIGMDFVEARLFKAETEKVIGSDSLIFDKKDRLFFTDWNEFPGVIDSVEKNKQRNKRLKMFG